jgi:hypothetical protein
VFSEARMRETGICAERETRLLGHISLFVVQNFAVKSRRLLLNCFPPDAHHKRYNLKEWSEILATDPEVRVRFPALPDFLKSTGSGTGSTQPREYN